jgi:hypothetical protein
MTLEARAKRAEYSVVAIVGASSTTFGSGCEGLV